MNVNLNASAGWNKYDLEAILNSDVRSIASQKREFPWLIAGFSIAVGLHLSAFYAFILKPPPPPAEKIFEMPAMALEMSLLPTVTNSPSLPEPITEIIESDAQNDPLPVPSQNDLPLMDSTSPDAEFEPVRPTPSGEPTRQPEVPVEEPVEEPPPKKVESPQNREKARHFDDAERKKEKKQSKTAQVAPSAVSKQAAEKKGAAKIQGLSSNASNSAMSSWSAEVKSRIEKAKRFPPKARAKGQQDTIILSITIDRSGRLLKGEIVRSKGFPDLDKEALALIQRVGRVPPPPQAVPGQVIVRTVNLRFFF